MLVSDFIRRNIHTISDQADFRQALETMVKHKTNGLIVVDEQEKPVGVIDSFHLIKAIIPTYLRDNPNLAQYEPDGVLHRSVSASLNKKVVDMMESLNGICVHEDDRFIKAATLASKHNIRYIPVVTKDEKLVGLVSRTDIKRAMASLLNIKDEDN